MVIARRIRGGVAVLVAGLALGVVAVSMLFGGAEQASTALDQQTVRVQEVSDSLGDLATRTSALCAAGGEDAALAATDICQIAAAVVADPEITTDALSIEQVRAIAQAAIAAQATASPDPAAILRDVLAAVRADPDVGATSEATVAAIVDSALAAQVPPADGRDGAPGTSFVGFERDEVTGDCYAVTRSTDASGQTSTARSPAGDSACAPRDEDDPPVIDEPDPGPRPGADEPADPPGAVDEPDPTTPDEPTPTLPSPVPTQPDEPDEPATSDPGDSSSEQTTAPDATDPPPLFGD